MKNTKSLWAIAALIFGVSTLSSCQRTEVTEQDGIEYRYHSEGSEKPENGMYVMYNLVIQTESDSVIYSTLDQPFPGYLQANDSLPANNGMDEIFLSLRKGDSISFQAPASVIFGNNQPPFLQADELVKVALGAFDVVDQQGIEALFQEAMAAENAKVAERAKELMVEEAAVIEQYAADNGLELQKTENGLYYIIERKGNGEEVTPGTTMYVDYAGYLLDGRLFDTSNPELAQANEVFNPNRDYSPLPVNVGMGQVIPGWDEGLLLLTKGAKAKFLIPSPLGYGENGAGGLIGPNSILVFDVEVMDVQK
ncbi:FKBP-type peptidyl-prolyl cis-trans isomerase [Algoriphagus namhaensis]|uniref:Peptidyl-prolyl cis-trans isomerase n=1 Tax=Algoriphagus namhaensis TaxID=915353 RepID=A0ABV8AQF4_9BACT